MASLVRIVSRSLARQAVQFRTISGGVSTLTRPHFIPQASLIHTSPIFSSKNDEDLVQFLTEEIKVEKENQKSLTALEGYQVKAEGADLSFTKDIGNEKVSIHLNVNHTVDSADPDDQSEEAPEMKSKPNFEVKITKGGKTLTFSCSFIYDHENQEAAAREEGYEDVFAIEEVAIFEGEWNDKKYVVAGDILDGHLYDLLMNMLEDRGITSEFVNKVSDYCSAYEHSKYIEMLEGLQSFVKK